MYQMSYASRKLKRNWKDWKAISICAWNLIFSKSSSFQTLEKPSYVELVFSWYDFFLKFEIDKGDFHLHLLVFPFCLPAQFIIWKWLIQKDFNIIWRILAFTLLLYWNAYHFKRHLRYRLWYRLSFF